MSNNNPILKIGQEVLFVIGLYQKMILKLNLFLTIVKICLGGHLGGQIKNCKKRRPMRSVISVIWVRFELTTHGLEDRCSIQLSYQTNSLTEHILV